MRYSVRHAAVGTDSTQLVLRDGRSVLFAAVPDSNGMPYVHAAIRRITQVEVSVAGDLVATRVHGIGHRRVCAVPVSLETALALAAEGYPCAVDLQDVQHPAASVATEVVSA